ncbi:MAG: M24 family metallopeptidase [bacterium]|nr:M24 family metallopeptidase [bacterium]
MELIRQKGQQACGILAELDIDLWLIFVRETKMTADPTLAMVVGDHATWQSFFAFTRSGESFALVGNLDAENYRRSGYFTETISYTQGIKQDFKQLLSRLDPGTVAVNYSLDDVAADGLSHGLYLQLLDYLEGTVYRDRLISAQALVSKLRARKLPGEIERLSKAAHLANDAWGAAVSRFQPGMTEKEIAAIIDAEIAAKGVTNSFETIVNAGDKTEPGHGLPSDAKIEVGDLLHVDFGVIYEGYCSDLQRLAYFKRYEEIQEPDELTNAFNMVYDIITETGEASIPGVKGFELDDIAREMLRDNGYPEYQHALGHQLGRDVHDGGGILGPKWERYGNSPTIPLEANNVFTLELEINLPGIGCVGLEEDVVVTEKGAEFLCPRQQELMIL